LPIDLGSPLRRLPTDLPRRQVLYLDALRVSFEMAVVGYDHLVAVLRTLMADTAPTLDGSQVDAIAYAWSVVDSLHRFRIVLTATPGIKHNHVYELFIRGTAGVESLRNAVQHISGELDQIAAQAQAPLGTLTWLGPSAAPNGPPTMFLLNVCTPYPGQLAFGPIVDLQSRLQEGTIANVKLSLSRSQLDITDAQNRLKSFVRSLAPAIATASADKPSFGADRLMRFQLIPSTPDSGDAA